MSDSEKFDAACFKLKQAFLVAGNHGREIFAALKDWFHYNNVSGVAYHLKEIEAWIYNTPVDSIEQLRCDFEEAQSFLFACRPCSAFNGCKECERQSVCADYSSVITRKALVDKAQAALQVAMSKKLDPSTFE